MTEPSSRQRDAEMYALANDDNLRNLLVWRSVKARAETGGFNGTQTEDYEKADAALALLLRSGRPHTWRDDG